MTKTLTKQWRDGKLPDGYYYIDYDTQQRIFEIEDGCATYQGLPAETYFLNDVCLIKVLAPVPSYDEYKKLRKLPLKCFQLEEDNSALMVINKDMCKTIERLQEQLKKLKQENTIHNNKAKKRRIHINNLKNENNQLREQLKEKNVKLNELRHQRNEANELISLLFPLSINKERALERTTEYMEKWGVK